MEIEEKTIKQISINFVYFRSTMNLTLNSKLKILTGFSIPALPSSFTSSQKEEFKKI